MTGLAIPPRSAGEQALLATLSDALPEVIEQIIELLSEQWPEYAGFLAADPEVPRLAAAALEHLVQLRHEVPSRPPAGSLGGQRGLRAAEAFGAFRNVGRLEFREGRTLGPLLSAYRAGARIAWRRLSAVAIAEGLSSNDVAALAEAVFIFIDDLSAASAQGYLEEQRAGAAERDRLRGALAELLLSDRATAAAVDATAAAAGWRVPSTVALVAAEPPSEGAPQLLGRLEAAALPVHRETVVGAVVADPDGPGRRDQLRRQLRGCGAVVGPAVPPQLLPGTVGVVGVAQRLRREGRLTDEPVFVDERLDAVLVHQDPRLLARLTARALAPLDAEPAASRLRLEQTLEAWLAAFGDRTATAAALGVHPQTVSYRLTRLRALFGDGLDDPRARLRLMLALCWR